MPTCVWLSVFTEQLLKCSMFSFGYFPGVWGLKVDVSEPSIGSIFLGRKMEPIEGSETSAFKPQTPGKYPKENILHNEQGESLKSRQLLKVRELERKVLAEQGSLILLPISSNALFIISVTHANFRLPWFPVHCYRPSTNFRTKSVPLNVNSGIRNLLHSCTYRLQLFSVNNKAMYSQKKRPKGLGFDDWGGRYWGPPTTNPALYRAVTRIIHYFSTENLCWFYINILR